MWRTLLLLAVILVVILFVGGNMHTTRVNLPFAKGFEVSTAFLLFLSFLLGFGTAHLLGFIKSFKNNRK